VSFSIISKENKTNLWAAQVYKHDPITTRKSRITFC